MEHPAAVSRRKLQKVYTLMHKQTRARLKTIAGLQGIPLFELLDTLAGDYIRGWEKLHKLNLDKLQSGDFGKAAKSATKRTRAKD
ncbi:MAG: hypothetical protein J0I77_22310 [Rudaea sp.]|uniref:hypothetical protein n=1 Tax=unclassified Rudaea TaxID=2627037 RepID=UPI0010F64A79|nr:MULTISPECIES: hypothetical protein [unclassified Rudaea]MBN8888463.1 hypothetical protein [Rudaea sp.]MBR0347315.1 hypothetical protein [Rudaea sp.]